MSMMTQKKIATQILERALQKKASPFGGMNFFSGDNVIAAKPAVPKPAVPMPPANTYDARPAAVQAARPSGLPQHPNPSDKPPALMNLGPHLQQQQELANKLPFSEWQKNPVGPPPAYDAAKYTKPTMAQNVGGGLIGRPVTDSQRHERAVGDYYNGLADNISGQNPSVFGRIIGYKNKMHPDDVNAGLEFINKNAPARMVGTSSPFMYASPASPGVAAAAAFARSPAGLNVAQQVAQQGSRVVQTATGAPLIMGGAAGAGAAPLATAAAPSAAGQFAQGAAMLGGTVAAQAGLDAAGFGPAAVDPAQSLGAAGNNTPAPDGTAAAQTQATQQPAPATAPATAPQAAGDQAQQQPDQPAAKAAPQNFQQLQTETTAILQDKNAAPEAKHGAMQKLMQAHADANPEQAAALGQGLKDKMAGVQTEASAQFDKSFEAAADNEIDTAFRAWKAQNPNSSPQEAGNFLGDITSQIKAMPPEAQWAMGVGVPLALLGLGMSVFGGGGFGSMLMTVLGLGAAGFGAASGGMLGADAQGAVNSGLGNIGQMLAPLLGINVPNKEDIQNRLTAAAKQGPQQAQAELDKVRAELQPYAKFSPESQKFLTESADKNYMFNQAQQYGEQNFSELADARLKNPVGRTWAQYAGNLAGLTGEAANQPGTWSASVLGAPGTDTRKQTVQNTMAQGGWEKQQSARNYRIIEKVSRCWKGYEPVPGKAPYSDNSCRPKGKAKKKKKVEKKAADGFSAVPFNPALGPKPPGNPRPDQVYNHQLYQSRAFLKAQQKNPTKIPPGWYKELDNYYGGKMPARPGGAPPAAAQPVQAPVVSQPAPVRQPAQSVKPATPPVPVTRPAPAPNTAPTKPTPTPTTGGRAIMTQAAPTQNPADAIYDQQAALRKQNPRLGTKAITTIMQKRLQRPPAAPSTPAPVTPQIVQNVTSPAATKTKRPTDFFSGSTPNINGIADQVREYQRLRAKEQGNTN
jgi:hypothetical protein